jgi:hypothetical protein
MLEFTTIFSKANQDRGTCCNPTISRVSMVTHDRTNWHTYFYRFLRHGRGRQQTSRGGKRLCEDFVDGSISNPTPPSSFSLSFGQVAIAACKQEPELVQA